MERVFTCEGLRCYVTLNELFCRCGYVEIDASSPLAADTDALLSLDVHGGVTFCCTCESPVDEVPVRVVGFDTAHLGDTPDVVSAYGAMRRGEISEERYCEVCEYASAVSPGHTWTLEETVRETKHLAHEISLLD